MNPEPVSITRIVRRMRGGSQAWLVLGDDGKSAPETRITREETHVIRGAFKLVSFRTGEIVRRIAVEGIVFGGDLMHAQVRAMSATDAWLCHRCECGPLLLPPI